MNTTSAQLTALAKPRALNATAFEVAGLLAGRITQLRRVVKPQPLVPASVASYDAHDKKWAWFIDEDIHQTPRFNCPFGAPGDVLRLRHGNAVSIERVVVSVRVEPVNKITEADVWASGLRRGIYSHSKMKFVECGDGTDAETPDRLVFAPIAAFHHYWNSINCKGNGDNCFEAGPWTWICTIANGGPAK